MYGLNLFNSLGKYIVIFPDVCIIWMNDHICENCKWLQEIHSVHKLPFHNHQSLVKNLVWGGIMIN